MKVLLSIVLLFFISCDRKMEKPFIIVDKEPSKAYKGYTVYTYQDKSGKLRSFYENNYYYQIGDTINRKP